MGEIVDLEQYRKQRKRRATDSAPGRRRRNLGRAGPKGDGPGPVIEPIETAHAETAHAESDPASKIDNDDQQAE